jgi:hypothetical protein
MVSLVVYTVARFLLAGGALGTYGVDARWFLFWDVITVPPYVWAIGKLVRSLAGVTDASLSALSGWTSLGLASFLAPYAYLYYAGAGAFPQVAWVFLSLVVLLFAANALRSIRRKVVAARVTLRAPAALDL